MSACAHERVRPPARPVPDWTGRCPDCGEAVKHDGRGGFETVREVNARIAARQTIEVEAPGPDVPIRRRAERAIVRGLKYIGGFGGQTQVGRPDGSFTIIAFDDTGNRDPEREVTVYARAGHHRPVCLDDVLDRLRDHGEFRHGEHAANYLEKERREGRL